MIHFLAVIAVLAGVQDTALSVIPKPVQMTRTAASFALTPGTAIVTDRSTYDIGIQLADWIQPATGYRLAVVGATGTGGQAISLRLDPALARLGDEGYRLTATRTRINIRAYRPAGAFYAVQTLRQLFPPEIFREAHVDSVRWSVPGVEIEDVPRFSWRG